MVKLLVTLKPNTSYRWISGKLLHVLPRGSSIHIESKDDTKGEIATHAIVEVLSQKELDISRAIRLISPQIVSVSRA
jgi:hypothetical protein